MIDLKFHCDVDASALAAQTSAAKNLLFDIKQDPMSGWLDLPSNYDREEVERIKQAAKQIQSDSKYLVCIGVGGSYLGHHALIKALKPVSDVTILYAGHSLSAKSIQAIFDKIGNDDFSITVTSKSGTTTEPAIAFRIFKQRLFEKYGENGAYKRIYATTDANKGALHDESLYNHYERFVVPDNIGGRFSVLTAVGLLPLAVAGVDIDELLAGAREESAAVADFIEQPKSEHDSSISAISENIFKYAAFRHIMRSRDYHVEVLSSFEPDMRKFTDWWKQLFGESEGKNNQGIFPAGMTFTTDLHALGQYLQQGLPNVFETIICFKDLSNPNITIPEMPENLDNLKYLEGKTLSELNQKALHATIRAHSQHLPVVTVELPDLSERSLGSLVYFFELACAVSAKLQGVNPFDQPGVDVYKKEMFKLFGKPGY